MSNEWIKVASLAEVPEDDVIGVMARDRELALYNLDGEIFATDNICTHGHARLSDGFVEDGEIECPLHQGKFCIKSGKAMCEPLTEDIRTYPTRVEGNEILILIS
ncbi:non-heme iron oxygenase ferredoxin subunit [Zobellella taiwanensis]|jgi:naphthalene 1,2-dioxygenase system ferredoxin subunit|uniref:Rieske (2Fe-2S) protein n=1 Tax=Zobellella taiwanensis TaxID=347535 RepID=A0A2P7QIN8_9GAMM|nr:non-heme iron oxygenase ferredoxin subunit [Zobellella taiwanensis]PSJ37806.1 Rieske (2Fe-2S) protein [Zobellella taiwanensis]